MRAALSLLATGAALASAQDVPPHGEFTDPVKGDQVIDGYKMDVVVGTPEQHEQNAIFDYVKALNKFNNKLSNDNFSSHASMSLVPGLTEALDPMFAEEASLYGDCSSNNLWQYSFNGGQVDYTDFAAKGGKSVASSMAGWGLDTSNSASSGAGFHQVVSVEYGKVAGVKYAVANIEVVKPLNLKDLYVDFALSLDGEEYYFGIYQLAVVMDPKDPSKIMYMGYSDGPKGKEIMGNKVMVEILKAANSKKGVSALELAQLNEQRAFYPSATPMYGKYAAATALAQLPATPASASAAPASAAVFSFVAGAGLSAVLFFAMFSMAKRTDGAYEPMLNP